jgi:allantoinase
MILRSRNVVGYGAASIHIEGEKIAAIRDYDDVSGGGGALAAAVPARAPAPPPRVVDYGDLVLMPGIVDSHVHVNEPGRTEWEGFDTATRAAAAGGVTTIVDMPLNSIPPTTSVEALRIKAEAMRGQIRVDVGLWGGAVPGNAGELRKMIEAGALGFKCFLVDSGVPEFGWLDERGLEEALEALAGTNRPLLVHAELGQHLHDVAGDPRSYARYLDSRPKSAENAAIELVAKLAGETHAHIVHLSSADALPFIGGNVTAETTPHYLYFASEDIPDGAPEYKCAPPIRERDNREKLWRALHERRLLAIVSDHSPCTPQLKRLDSGDVEHAWGGIASLQFSLPVVWTSARRRGFTLRDLTTFLCEGPAQLASLGHRKGRLAPGYDADIIAFDPDAAFVVRESIVQHRHKVTPYAGEELNGVVRATYVRGKKVWEDGAHIGDPHGTWLTSAS